VGGNYQWKPTPSSTNGDGHGPHGLLPDSRRKLSTISLGASLLAVLNVLVGLDKKKRGFPRDHDISVCSTAPHQWRHMLRHPLSNAFARFLLSNHVLSICISL